MKRKIIHIDKHACNGCGLCVNACHEGAIQLINGKAELIRDDYCDGLGNCLPVCPTGAITFEEREALAYDQKAVDEHLSQKKEEPKLACGCSGSTSKIIERSEQPAQVSDCAMTDLSSKLSQWPVQIKLVPANAPYLQHSDLLIAADCTAFAYGDFHNRFIKNHVTLIGCPKLDSPDYTDKLTQILENNEINSITVVRMEVPCCGGIVNAVKNAMINSKKIIPWQVVTISTEGQILN